MQITLTPVRLDTALTLHRSGDVLVINGVSYDFSPLPEGALLPREAVGCDWLASDVERIGGEIHLTLILPHGAHAPEATRHPAPITLTGDGPVTLPPHDTEEPAACSTGVPPSPPKPAPPWLWPRPNPPPAPRSPPGSAPPAAP